LTEKDWQSRETPGHQCYVAAQGERYPRGYDPTYYPGRLNEPKKERGPQRIFAVSVGDLFGSWVPAAWIKSVIGVMEHCNWHRFYLLTKNPKRYAEFSFPSNCWLGATVTSDRDIKTLQTLQSIPHEKKFLSIEPLVGQITLRLDGIGWTIIGAMTGENPIVPNEIWIEQALTSARRVGSKIFMKDNILPFYHGRRIYTQVP
jgi:protein gp37